MEWSDSGSRGETVPPARPQRFGVAAKLRNAYIGISLLSLLAAAVGLLSLHTIQNAQEAVLDRSVPAMLDAQRVAKEGLAIIEATSALIEAGDNAAFESETARIEVAVTELRRLLTRLKTFGAQSGQLARIGGALESILQNLDVLGALIAAREETLSQSAFAADEARRSMEVVIAALQPEIIDASDRVLDRSDLIKDLLSGEGVDREAAREAFVDLSEVDYFAVETLVGMRFQARSLRDKVSRLLLTTEPVELAALRNDLDLELRGMARAALEIERAAVKAQVADSLQTFRVRLQGADNLFDQRQRLFWINERLDQVSTENREASDLLSSHVEGLQQQTDRLIQRSQAEARNTVVLGRVMLVTIALAALVAAIWVVRRYVMRDVAARTLRLAQITRELARGKLKVEVDVEGDDELGEMADAVRVFKANATELRRSNAELEQFAYAASHDLQEPLRMVSSFTELLQQRYQGRLDSEADEFIGYARDGAVRMQAMINGLLDYSKAGGAESDREKVDSGKAADAALVNLQAALSESGASVELGDLPRVLASRTQLVNLFQNLIGNAIKYRRRGVVPEVRVEAARAEGMWRFTVADNGIGIAANHGDEVFKIFKRLHGRHEFEGSGLGLSICQRIVEVHGGRIWLDSEPGVGSRFSFTLPAA